MRHVIVATALLCVMSGAQSQAVATERSATPTAAATRAMPAPASSIPTLQTITVTGVVPGPGLWKVTQGKHALWLLGVVPTVPAGIQWQSAEVAGVIAGSQAVIEAPEVDVSVDANWFQKLFLLLPVYRAKRNPDGRKLEDVLPPALYSRWQVQRQRYLADDNDVARYRPILAASKLLKQALKAHGLRSSGKIEDTITALAQQRGATLVSSSTSLTIHHPHRALKAFRQQGPDGVACFSQVLDVVEHQLPAIRARANAWATGDIAALRGLPGRNYREICKAALLDAGFARQLGIANLAMEVQNHWLGVAEAALASNAQSFAVLPMHDLLDPQGYLAALKARGYAITPPDTGTRDKPGPSIETGPLPAASASPAN